jgi:hypothetical protein
MGRYGLFRIASGDGGACLPPPIVASEAALAVVDGAIAAAAFVQVGWFDPVCRVLPPLVINGEHWGQEFGGDLDVRWAVELETSWRNAIICAF